MNILIIGCGITGKAIVRGIVNLESVKKIYLYDKYLDVSESFCSEINNIKIKVVNDITKLNDLDYVIVVLSAVSEEDKIKAINEKPSSYEMRQNQLKFNLKPISYLVNVFNNYDDKTKIIVVTNPIDEFTNYLHKNLKNKIVYGFGLDLDAYRYGLILGSDIFCIGLHGKAVPVVDFGSDKEYDDLLNESDARLTAILKQRGVPDDQMELVFGDFFKKLISEGIVHLCYYISKPFLGVKDVCISLPFNVKDGLVVDVTDFYVNEIEKKRFVNSVYELRKPIDLIINT